MAKKVFEEVSPVRRVRDGKKERYCIVTGVWLPVGVSWSDHYQKFRAWKDVADVQVRHGLFEKAAEAIAAREAWDREFSHQASARVARAVAAGEPGYRGKQAFLPKEDDRAFMLYRFKRNLRAAHVVIDEAPKTRTNPISASRRSMLGVLVGILLSDVEYLTSCGMLKVDDIQAAMQRESRRLAGEDDAQADDGEVAAEL